MAQFITWLKNQQDRSDAIGRLAAAANRDQEFPRANKLNVIVDYLKSKGANDKLLDTVENAYAEFENAPRRKTRKPEAAPTEKKKPAPKTVAPLPPKPVQNSPGPEARATPKAEKPVALAEQAPKPSRARKQPTAGTTPAAVPAAVPAAKPAARKATAPPKAGSPPAPKTRQRKAAEPKAAPQPEQRNPEARPQNAPQRQPRQQPAVQQLPERLLPLQRQLADAGAVLDAQFGKGYAAKNPGQVLDFARMLLTAEQNRMLHFTFADLAEALHRVGSRLDGLLRQPF